MFGRVPQVFVGICGSFRGVSVGIQDAARAESYLCKTVFFSGYPHFGVDALSGSVANSSVSSTFRRFPRVFVGVRRSFRGVSAGIREESGMHPGQKARCVKRSGYPHFWADEVSGSVANSNVSYTFRRFPRVFVGIRGSFRGVSVGIREVSGMHPGHKASCVNRCFSQGIRSVRRMRCQDLLQIAAHRFS